MATVDHIRNSLISKIMAIKDQEILNAIDKLLSRSDKELKVELSKEQITMLKMSEQDVANGSLISNEELFERERKWINEK